MDWPTRAPSFLPAPVWQRAKEWRAHLPANDPAMGALVRLITNTVANPAMGKTWSALDRRGVDADTKCRLLDLFIESTPGRQFAPAHRDQAKQLSEHCNDIAKHATALAALLERVHHLHDLTGLSLPPALLELEAPLRAATDPLASFTDHNHWPLDLDHRAMLRLLRHIATKAEQADIAPTRQQDTFATTGKSGQIADWVRWIDAMLPTVNVRTEELHLTDTDLARIGAAVLYPVEVKRRTVSKSRASAPHPTGQIELFLPITY